MADHRQNIPISQKLFSFLELQEEAGELPCQNFPDLFYPEGKDKAIRDDTKLAKQLCQQCPIIDECRMYALQAKETYGIWGGLDAQDREQFLKTISSSRFQLRHL